MRQEPDRRVALLDKSAKLREALSQQGWQIGQTQSQIIPIYLGEPELTMHLAERLFEQGLFIPGIRPPSVPAGESLLRVSLSAAHSSEQIQQLIETLDGLRSQM